MAQYDSREQILKLGEDNPQLTAFLKQGGDDVMSTVNSIHHAIVTHTEAARQALPGTKDTDYEYDVRIPTRDGFENVARIFKPEAPVPGRATVVFIHGGGFAIGHPTHISHYARGIARLFGTTVIAITHRLTPQVRFPTPSNDVWDALEWIFPAGDPAATAAALGEYNRSSFVIGGVSAGANLSAVTAQKWVSAGKTPKLAGVYLNIPWLLEPEIVPEKYAHLWLSREQNAGALIINGQTLRDTKASYRPDVLSADFSPLNDGASAAHGHGHGGRLPPVYFQVCGQDPLRDDAIIYEKVLRDGGVPTRIDVYAGVPHGFADLLPTFGPSREFLADAMRGFAWLFGDEAAASDEEVARALATA